MEFNLIQTKESTYTIKVCDGEKSFFLASYFYPKKEAQITLEKIHFKKEQLVFLGLGNFYLIIETLKTYPNKNVFVVEPFKEVYNLVNNVFPLNEFSNLSVLCSQDIEEIKNFLTNLGDFEFIPNTQYISNFSLAREIHDYVKNYLSNLQINKNTFAKFGKIWFRNLVSSFRNITKARGVKELFGKFRDLTFAVVGAGPSLDRDIDIIKLHRNKMVIVSSDTAFPVLVKHDIIPDIVITVDSQWKNFIYIIEGIQNSMFRLTKNITDQTYEVSLKTITQNLKKFSPSETLFVSDVSYSSIIYEFIDLKNIFLFDAPFPMWEFMKKKVGEKGEVLVGGSVVCSAIDLSFKLGASEVLLFGNDLSYTDGKIYCKHNYFEKEFKTRDNFLERYDPTVVISQYPVFLKPSKSNNLVLTDLRMMTFKKWIEDYFHKNNSKIYDCTYRGVKLDLMRDFDFSKLSDKSDLIKNIKTTLLENYKPITGHQKIYADFEKELQEKIILLQKSRNNVYKVINILESDIFLKVCFEMVLQRILVSNYTEEDFLKAIPSALDYIVKIFKFSLSIS